MSDNSNDRQSKDKETQETTEEDLDFHLDDFDDEIIDLVDPLEGEGGESDDSSGHDEILDEDKDLSFEEFDVEMELGEDEPSLDLTKEPFEDEEGSRTDYSNESESELGESFHGEDETSEATAAETDEGISEDDLVTDEALAELFASHESEVAKLLEEATGSPVEDKEAPSAGPVSISEEELPEDLFADLDMETEAVSEEGDAAEEVLSDEVVTDFDKEIDSVIDETVAAASTLAGEEVVEDEVSDFEEEIEEVSQMDIPEEIAPATAEELAALVSGQVEEVVTRLVEEQLPSIVERLVAQEIEKIKSSLESGE